MPAQFKTFYYGQFKRFFQAGIFIFMLIAYFNGRKKRFIQEQQLLKLSFNEQLLQAQLETRELAFNQVSQELHDNVGQLLSSTKMLLGVAGKQIQIKPDSFVLAQDSLSKAINDLRSFSKSLNAEWLSQFDFIENLQLECDRINTARQITITVESFYSKIPFEPKAQVILFRVIQEAIQNILKHAEAKHIAITIRQDINNMIIHIADDGKGFDIEAEKQKGLGLRNMEQRVHLLHGSIEWNQPGKGTDIRIIIPA